MVENGLSEREWNFWAHIYIAIQRRVKLPSIISLCLTSVDGNTFESSIDCSIIRYVSCVDLHVI